MHSARGESDMGIAEEEKPEYRLVASLGQPLTSYISSLQVPTIQI